MEKCPICKRIPPSFEKHHLLPKPYRNRAKMKKEKFKMGKPKFVGTVPKQKELICRPKDTIRICIDCADMLHQLFTNKELATEYNSLEKILAVPRIQKWIKWIKNKEKFGIFMKTKKRR